ncbi:Alpha/Beta hydrolase protein [Sporodiniella umbellata]|nr:Alpha/Beta hydrolase protein [Sporodiniella umbellata]
MMLHYKLFGLKNSSKSPIVFLIHGATGDLIHQNTLATELSRLGCRVIACDIRYHGLSQPIIAKSLTQLCFEDILDDIEYVIHKVKETYYYNCEMNLFIGGLSMGGILSLLYATRNEQSDWLQKQGICLKGIILISVIFPSLLSPRLEWEPFKSPVFNQSLVDLFKDNIVQSSRFESSQMEVQRSMKYTSDRVIYQCLFSVANSLLASSGNNDPPTRIATLLIVPEKDEYTRSDMERVYEINKKHGITCEKTVIENALHMVILDDGIAVAKSIASFCLSK